MALDFDVLSNCGDNRAPGTETDIFLACTCDVDSPFPDFVGAIVQGDSVSITDDILLVAGKQFYKMRVISESGEIKHELVGSQGSKSYKQMFAGKTVTDKNYDEFFNNNRNGCMIALIPDKTGQLRLMGHPTKGHVTFASASCTSGTNAESAAEWTFELMASPGYVAPYYSGVVDVTP